MKKYVAVIGDMVLDGADLSYVLNKVKETIGDFIDRNANCFSNIEKNKVTYLTGSSGQRAIILSIQCDNDKEDESDGSLKADAKMIYNTVVSEKSAELGNLEAWSFDPEDWDEVAEYYVEKMRESGYGWIEICEQSKDIPSYEGFGRALFACLMDEAPESEKRRIFECALSSKSFAGAERRVLPDDIYNYGYSVFLKKNGETEFLGKYLLKDDAVAHAKKAAENENVTIEVVDDETGNTVFLSERDNDANCSIAVYDVFVDFGDGDMKLVASYFNEDEAKRHAEKLLKRKSVDVVTDDVNGEIVVVKCPVAEVVVKKNEKK